MQRLVITPALMDVDAYHIRNAFNSAGIPIEINFGTASTTFECEGPEGIDKVMRLLPSDGGHDAMLMFCVSGYQQRRAADDEEDIAADSTPTPEEIQAVLAHLGANPSTSGTPFSVGEILEFDDLKLHASGSPVTYSPMVQSAVVGMLFTAEGALQSHVDPEVADALMQNADFYELEEANPQVMSWMLLRQQQLVGDYLSIDPAKLLSLSPAEAYQASQQLADFTRRWNLCKEKGAAATT